MTSVQPFNVFGPTQGVFPPASRATVPMPQGGADSYYLMTHKEDGPRDIPFWHENTCHPETVVTLQGDYFITVGNERVHQKPGDVLVIPTGVKHGDVSTQVGYRNLQIENTHPECSSPPQQA